MPFKFRLEPLITIRDNVLKEKQGELAKAYEARRKLEEKQVELEQELAATVEAGRNMLHGGGVLDVDYLLSLRRHEGYILAQRDEVLRMMVAVDEEIERRRTAVMEAHRDLKTVEKLKEKQKAKYDAEQAKKETVMMDEIAMNGKLKMEN